MVTMRHIFYLISIQDHNDSLELLGSSADLVHPLVYFLSAASPQESFSPVTTHVGWRCGLLGDQGLPFLASKSYLDAPSQLSLSQGANELREGRSSERYSAEKLNCWKDAGLPNGGVGHLGDGELQGNSARG